FTLLRGRTLTERDRAYAPLVVVVNQAFAAQFLRGDEPLGRHVSMDGVDHEIIGVVADVQTSSGWGNFGPVGRSPNIYMPVAQMKGSMLMLHTWFSPSWVVRS